MKKQHGFTLFVMGLLVMTAPGIPAETRKMVIPEARSTAASALLQFTSSGHVLGFAQDAIYVADGLHAYRVAFVGAQPTAPVADSAQGEAGRAAPLSRVTYPDLWPGITLTYDAPEGAILRSTYRLEPFADPAAIRLRYNVPAQIENDGSLALAYDTGVMRESAPVAWQEIGNARVPVQIAFRHPRPASGNREVGFAVGAYDPAYPLFIDPILTRNTFLGASAWVVGNAIAVDGGGNVYVAGTSNVTWGTPVRAHSGQYDAFVAKLNSSGGLTWNTFLGGSGYDWGVSVTAGGGNVWVAGSSNASWQGASPPVRSYSSGYDAFAASLNSITGGLFWNTFLGGSGDDHGGAVAIYGGGSIYIAGHSTASWQGTSAPLRAYTGGFDVFVARLNSSGTLTWNTFLGGGADDYGGAIAVDGSDNLYVTGDSLATLGLSIRDHNGDWDAFAAQLYYRVFLPLVMRQ